MADPRYVILHHCTRDGEHWDLMLEHGGVLLTWQLPRRPYSPSDLPLSAIRIGDHRLAYLEYEGPVSGDRGTVRRVDAGALSELQPDGGTVRFQLSGGQLAGALELVCVRDDRWLLMAQGTHIR